MTDINIGKHALLVHPEPFGQTPLKAVRSLSADLLFMGPYVHSPLGEVVFGGVTRYVLDHSRAARTGLHEHIDVVLFKRFSSTEHVNIPLTLPAPRSHR